VIPVVKSKQLLGGLTIYSKRTVRVFKPEEIELLYIFANQTVSAIDNATLYQRVNEQSKHLEVIGNLTKSITSSVNIGDVFETFAEGVKSDLKIDFDRLTIAVIEKDEIRLLAIFSEIETWVERYWKHRIL
jgi:signal transduction protein with GAF and PtsI domain